MPKASMGKVAIPGPEIVIETCKKCGAVFEGMPRKVEIGLRLHLKAKHSGKEDDATEVDDAGAAGAALGVLLERHAARQQRAGVQQPGAAPGRRQRRAALRMQDNNSPAATNVADLLLATNLTGGSNDE